MNKDRHYSYFDLIWLVPFIILKFAIVVVAGTLLAFLGAPILLIALLARGDTDKVTDAINDWMMRGGFRR